MPITNGEWPNLVAESQALLFDSIIMYALPDLHELARKKLLKEGDADRVVNFPIKSEELLKVIVNNKEALKAHFDPTDYKLYGTALLVLKEEIEKLPDGKEALMESELVSFDDKHSNSELVYGITKNDVDKRITVCFRGTVTLKDLQVDAAGLIDEFANPVDDSKQKIGIHHGFYEYLNGTQKGKLDGVSKYSEIMSQLSDLFQQNAEYRLYVTGHSLGASLAQLFSMQAAACNDELIPKPVTTINFASPKVGDIYFRNSFEELEDQGKLRCLRFCNDADIIPTLPDRKNCSCFRTLRCKPSVFRHAGPKVILYPDGEFEIRYEKRDKETAWKFFSEAWWTTGHGLGFALMVPSLVRFSKEFLTNHSCEEYMNRFIKFGTKRGGNKVFLNDVYKNEAALDKLLEDWSKS